MNVTFQAISGDAPAPQNLDEAGSGLDEELGQSNHTDDDHHSEDFVKPIGHHDEEHHGDNGQERSKPNAHLNILTRDEGIARKRRKKIIKNKKIKKI